MSGLTRLYPKTWRDRYGHEFDALLEDTSLTLPVLADVLMGAARARVTASVAALRTHPPSAASMVATTTGLRVGAVSAASAGMLWALTFLTGSLVEWGKYGRDLGFVLLIAAAAGLFVAQLTMTVDWHAARGRALAHLGVVVSAVGMAVLGLALLAAMAVSRPWSMRFAWTPLDVLMAGMALMLIGCTLLASAWLRGGRVVAGALLGAAAVALLLVSVLPAPPPEVSIMLDQIGRFRGAYRSGSTGGWFDTDPRTFMPAALFGVTWMLVGLGQMRRYFARPAPST